MHRVLSSLRSCQVASQVVTVGTTCTFWHIFVLINLIFHNISSYIIIFILRGDAPRKHFFFNIIPKVMKLWSQTEFVTLIPNMCLVLMQLYQFLCETPLKRKIQGFLCTSFLIINFCLEKPAIAHFAGQVKQYVRYYLKFIQIISIFLKKIRNTKGTYFVCCESTF